MLPAADSGKPGAEARLIQQHGPRVRKFLASSLSCHATAEDLFQECFFVAIRKLRQGQLREPGRSAAFVLGIARVLLRAHFRRLACHERRIVQGVPLDELPSDVHGPERVLESRIRRRLLGEALSKLPLIRDREALIRRYFGEQNIDVIALDLGVSGSEMRVILCRKKAPWDRRSTQNFVQRPSSVTRNGRRRSLLC